MKREHKPHPNRVHAPQDVVYAFGVEKFQEQLVNLKN